MANKLIIILHRSYHNEAVGLKPLFFQAAVSAAMQYETEIILSGINIELARPGIAAELFLPGENGKTIHNYMQDAVEAGVSIKVCSAPADMLPDTMIPEIQERVGSTYLISEIMDQDTVTLTY